MSSKSTFGATKSTFGATKSTFGATKSTFGAKKYCSKVFDSQNLLVMKEHLPRTLPRNILSIFSGRGSTIFLSGGAVLKFFGVGAGRGSHFCPGRGGACIPDPLINVLLDLDR